MYRNLRLFVLLPNSDLLQQMHLYGKCPDTSLLFSMGLSTSRFIPYASWLHLHRSTDFHMTCIIVLFFCQVYFSTFCYLYILAQKHKRRYAQEICQNLIHCMAHPQKPNIIFSPESKRESGCHYWWKGGLKTTTHPSSIWHMFTYRGRTEVWCGRQRSRGEWRFLCLAGMQVESVSSPLNHHWGAVGPPTVWSVVGEVIVSAGFAYARSRNPERSMDRVVSAMTGSVRHMMGRPVEVRAVSHSPNTALPLSPSLTCESHVSISGVFWSKKRLCRRVQDTHPASIKAFDVPSNIVSLAKRSHLNFTVPLFSQT